MKKPTKDQSCAAGSNDRHFNFGSNRLQIDYFPVGELSVPARQLRKFKRGHQERLQASIQEFGFLLPLLVTKSGEVVVGAQRFEAALAMGFDELPVIVVTHLSEAQVKAFRMADNKLAEGATWNPAELKREFEDILNLEIDFDLRLTGFQTAEIDLTLEFDDVAAGDDEDVSPSPDDMAVSRRGDLWLIGDHRLLCGDALDEVSFSTLMEGELARIAVTDMPFNCKINGHVGGTGATKHREFVQASGEMSDDEFEQFVSTALLRLSERLVDGALIYAFMDFNNIELLLRAGRELGLSLKNLIVWAKQNAGMGSLYRSQHELIALFKKGNEPHINNVQLGATGRYRTNVWDYAGMNSFGPGRMDDLSDHPTVKPAAMIADAIRDATDRGDIVLDSFAGSGTLLVAAQRTGRKARCVELDPLYVDCAIKRFEERFGVQATLSGSNLTFAEVQVMRLAEGQADALSLSGTVSHGSAGAPLPLERVRPSVPGKHRVRASFPAPTRKRPAA
ncbi:MAG: site-specific DNA-methyltransferase [Hyphomicrobiaceae bacterium]|nr:site-specific DNA-methyltransferase [Hyphomicrobiaceae bacterium]